MIFPLDETSYQLIHLIGQGATSQVYSARCLTNNQMLAIKLVDLESYSSELDYLRQEVAFWSSSAHPNIVKYYGSFISGAKLYILMEYMPGGSVADALHFGFKNGFDDENVIKVILHANLFALEYIHRNNELHRDIKPANTLIGENGEIKIGDFGVAAKLMENGQRKRARYTVIGTPCYMAPEVLKEEIGYTEKADIWSFGIQAIELALGKAPYSDLNPLAIVQKILNAPPPRIPNDGRFSENFILMVRQCLNHDPNKRPSAAQLLQSPFFQNVENYSYIKQNVLDKLKPVEERYVLLESENMKKVKKNVGKPKWSYNDEIQPKENNGVQKGRFNIKKQSSSDIKEPIITIEDNEDIVKLNQKIQELEVRINTLSQENEEIKEQIKMILQNIMRKSK